jgi:hypothetical protein
MALFSDGLVHVFCDGGDDVTAYRPVCGASVAWVARGGLDDYMHSACVKWLHEWAGDRDVLIDLTPAVEKPS